MSTPTGHKTVQARILEYAEAIGWTFVSQKEAEHRRGFDPPSPRLRGTGPEESRAKGRTLFFEDLLDAKVREFNPRYVEAEGALPGKFPPSPMGYVGTSRQLHTDIYGHREFTVRRASNRRERRDRREDLDSKSLSSLRSLRLPISESFDHEEKRERDLILIRKMRPRGFPDAAFRPGIPSPERLNHRERREPKEDLDFGSLSALCSLRLPISEFKRFDRRERRDRKEDIDRSIWPRTAANVPGREFWHRLRQNRLLSSKHFCNSLPQNFHSI